MTSRSLPRKKQTPPQTSRRDLRSQSANKKLVSAPKQTFTRRQIPRKQQLLQEASQKQEPLPKKKRGFSFPKKKKKEELSSITTSHIAQDLPGIAKTLDSEAKDSATDQAPAVKPLKRQHISMVTSARAIGMAAVISCLIIVIFGVFSLRIGKNDSQGFFAVNKLSYSFHEPERFDAVQVQTADGNSYLAQIVALPDEQIFELSDGVYIQLSNDTSFSLSSLTEGRTIRLESVTLEGKHTLLQHQMHYVLPLKEPLRGRFVSREAIKGRVIWE